MQITETLNLPGASLQASKMPGHWLLARLGKRVLRPGGLNLTRRLLESLAIKTSDDVVEFAPGMGVTARMTLGWNPAAYTAIEDDEAAANRVRRFLTGAHQQCLVGNAEKTPLPDQSATVVYGEAMLTMQGTEQKHRIVREAARLLKPGGRYGIHELCLVPDNLDEQIKREIEQALSQTIHVGARPLTAGEWRAVLEAEGFKVQAEAQRPMRLLEPDRLIQDEGFWGTLRFMKNLLRDKEARRRVLAMRRIFVKYRSHMAAIMLVGVKTSEAGTFHLRDPHADAKYQPALH
ncbi:MAG: methyltransferase domain-containing protein [Verrucomicrobia bacterium]|nr:methyltransferase domain-containing protein [Verrucomicrobiota bacterium]MDE3100285.1 methyltransferase domain-containing protein [Verrucomicrobiota bacterium]